MKHHHDDDACQVCPACRRLGPYQYGCLGWQDPRCGLHDLWRRHHLRHRIARAFGYTMIVASALALAAAKMLFP